MRKTSALKRLLTSDRLEFILEAHNGLSGKIVEETGFPGIWASGLTISASLGVRDNNEASWTQVLEVLEFMSDATSVPILLDGDTGYGNFNNVRRLVHKLEQRSVAGVCLEDKHFPKTNSFINGSAQPLADMDEFCGKIKAAKDAQVDPDFCVVARVEALIAGWGMGEALKRAQAYREAGADAILIHSKLPRPDEIVSFMEAWDGGAPVVIVPTTYYGTPTEVFERAGVSLVIWANHLCRSAITAMQETAATILRERSLAVVEDRIATVGEVFRIQGAAELQDAERRYLPSPEPDVSALLLAASRGVELGDVTAEMPKAMVPIGGKPLLHRTVDTLNELGVKDITVIRGYRKEKIHAPNVRFVDNDDHANTSELYSLYLARERLDGTTLIAYGDILFRKYIPLHLLDEDGDIVIVVDAGWQSEDTPRRFTELVECDRPFRRDTLGGPVHLRSVRSRDEGGTIDGEWIGLMKVSPRGASVLRRTVEEMAAEPGFERFRMPSLFRKLIDDGESVRVIYVVGHWVDVNTAHDLSKARAF